MALLVPGRLCPVVVCFQRLDEASFAERHSRWSGNPGERFAAIGPRGRPGGPLRQVLALPLAPRFWGAERSLRARTRVAFRWLQKPWEQGFQGQISLCGPWPPRGAQPPL